LLGIELVDVAQTAGRDTKTPATDAAEEIFYRALDAGLSFKVSQGNVLTLTPPLTISEGELDRALGILEGCIGEAG
jgi:4-aminobutyrate aminotransferase